MYRSASSPYIRSLEPFPKLWGVIIPTHRPPNSDTNWDASCRFNSPRILKLAVETNVIPRINLTKYRFVFTRVILRNTSYTTMRYTH